MAQKPISRSGTGSISASGFLPAQVCKLVLSSTTNSNEVAPNAVIQLNKNNNRNEEQATTEVRNSRNLIGPNDVMVGQFFGHHSLSQKLTVMGKENALS